MLRAKPIINEADSLYNVNNVAERPIFFMIAASTKRLCEISTMTAKMTTENPVRFTALIAAIKPYSSNINPVISGTAASPGMLNTPISGAQADVSQPIAGVFFRMVINRYTGIIIFIKNQQVFRPLINPFFIELVNILTS